MSSTRCEVINWLLFPLAASVGCIFWSHSFQSQELFILKLLTVIAVTAHIHYGVCVVRQMADHFDIEVFSIKRKIANHTTNDRHKLLDKRATDGDQWWSIMMIHCHLRVILYTLPVIPHPDVKYNIRRRMSLIPRSLSVFRSLLRFQIHFYSWLKEKESLCLPTCLVIFNTFSFQSLCLT